MTGPWWEPEARELHDACERCGDEALCTLTADGELCGPCRDELAGELEQIGELLGAPAEGAEVIDLAGERRRPR